MNITYYLDKPSAPKTTLMVDVTFSGERARYSSGLSLAPAYWNHEKQQVRASDPLQAAHEQRLDRVYAISKEVYEQMELGAVGRLVTKADAKDYENRVKARLKPLKSKKSKVATVSTAVAPSDFFQYYDYFVRTYTITTRTGKVTMRRPSEKTLRCYRDAGKTLQRYAAEQGTTLTFEAIDMDFYRRFTNWMATKRNLLDSSAGNHIKNLKVFMRWAMDDERKLHSNIAFTKFYRSTSDENEVGVALTLEELRQLRDADLSGDERLRRTRDTHLLQTFTALRYSDLELLEPKNYDFKNKFVVSPIQKTGSKNVIIPMVQPCEELLRSFPSLQIKFYYNWEQNLHLKQLGQLIGLDAPVIVCQYRGGQRIETVVPKWQQLTTHSARRTFMTISLEEFGLPEQVVYRVTGHKPTNRVAARYFKGTREGIKTAVCNAWAAF